MSSESKSVPLVSVHIAAYNHEQYVQETIQSIIDQDYPRIELIVTDDGSKDATWAKIEEMRPVCERRFERVVFRTRENRGCNFTCQENVALAHGEFIGGIASDDRYLPGAISALVEPMIADPGIGLTVGVNAIMDGEGRRCYWDERRNNVYDKDVATYLTFDDYTSSYSKVDFSSEDFGRYETLVRSNYIPNGSFYRASIRTPSAGEGILLEDWWWHLQMSKVTKYKYVPQETFAYRWHGANTASQSEKMHAMGLMTQRMELDLLRRGMPDSRFADAFRSVLPLSETVSGVRIGTHYPHIENRTYWDYEQLFAVVSGRSFPVSLRRYTK